MQKKTTNKKPSRKAEAIAAARSSKTSLGRSRKGKKVKSLSAGVKGLVRDPSVTNMLSYAGQVQAEGADFIAETFAIELGLSRALVSASAWLAMALHLNRGDERLYPRDWLDHGATCNPDFVMGCVLCQVANHGYSVLSLVERGLDTPARVVLRSAADLCYMLALLGNDRQALQSYVVDKSVTEKQRWYNLFSGRKLAARLNEIDRKIGLPTEWTKFMDEFRVQNNEFFSEATHHSPNAVLVGSLPVNPRTSHVELNLLGGPNSFSRATLNHLATVLNYGLTMFLQGVAELGPHFTAPQYWTSGVQLVDEVQPLFLHWLRQGEHAAAADSEAE